MAIKESNYVKKENKRVVTGLWVAFGTVAFAIVFFITAVAFNFLNLFGGTPSLDSLANPNSEIASEIYSSDNKVIGKYFRENRSLAAYEELNDNLKKALYATEDVRFEEHSGIDLKGLISIGYYLMQGKRRGSSTLTQQLAKNLFSTRGELYEGVLTNIPVIGTVIIKTKEWIVAIKLERTYTKREILTMYLNTVHFGSNAFGIKTAAKTYFSTTPARLTVPQAALLVGVLKGQSMYSPIYRPVKSLERRNTVIDQMVKYNYLTDTQASKYKATILIDRSLYNVESQNDGNATYFRAELRKEILPFIRDNNLDLYADGLKIYTTIDSKLQAHAEEAVDKHITYLQKKFNEYWGTKNPWVDENGNEIKNFLDNAAKRSERYKDLVLAYDGNTDSAWLAMHRPVSMRVFSYDNASTHEKRVTISPYDSIRYYKHFLHAGLISMEPSTGFIKAWVGGINFRFFKYDHVKQGRRQPGSSFKPIVYAAAIDKGYNPCLDVVDQPITFHTASGDWTPKNSDGKYSYAHLTLRKAMARSINTIAAFLIEKITPQSVVDFARRLGITSPLDPVPPLCLGSSDVTLYEMVGAYSTFVNNGTYIKPYFVTRIEDKHGNVLRKFTPEKKEVLSPEVAYNMVYMLRGGTTERGGTAMGLHRLGKTLVGNQVGGKTGTTSNYSDGWFMGITRDLVTGVWVGGDDRSIHFRTADLGQGARMAMPIWSYYMDAAYQDPTTNVKKGAFIRPEGVPDINCNAVKTDTDSTYKAPQETDFKEEL